MPAENFTYIASLDLKNKENETQRGEITCPNLENQ